MAETLDSPLNVLFLCSANSARSILAEAQLNALGRGRFRAWSAGSAPAGQLHPRTLAYLAGLGLPTDGLRSKSWDEFAQPGAPVMDYVITVCDRAAGETCPVWPGHPVSAHWGVPDPVAVQGSDELCDQAFRDAAHVLRRRIELFMSLPLSALDRLSLHQHLGHIGRT